MKLEEIAREIGILHWPPEVVVILGVIVLAIIPLVIGGLIVNAVRRD